MSALNPRGPTAICLRIRGVVQGVGFRPTVARVARLLDLTGNVANDGQGVRVFVEGERAYEFEGELLAALPPLARVDSIEVRDVEVEGHASFEILASAVGPARTDVVADSAMCAACWEEVKSPYERRYRYPFANCTHCGPRFSIIEAMPYDRARTTMASFSMCPSCKSEYTDANDRRYHAQPVACHACGPRAWLQRGDGAAVVSDMFSGLDDVDAIATLLKQGEIVAIRSIGGYHLVCDATQSDAVERLRTGKSREAKPFAVMVRDLEILESYAVIGDAERALLTSPAGPIVLLERKAGARRPLADSVSPGTTLVGAMIPYTPLHALIMKRMDVPVVMTSGNVHGEPQCTDVDDAMMRLGEITPWFLHHNREIVDRIDDSVTRVIAGIPTVLRRARGYAPDAWTSPPGLVGHGIAMGGDLKSAFAVAGGDRFVLSHHLGTLDEPQTRDGYVRAIDRYVDLFDIRPQWIAVDDHPGYASRRLGESLASRFEIELVSVQHHHAHVAACLADHASSGPVVGIVLDGTGWGEDETAWGGEVLVADYTQFERMAALRPQPLLGGDAAAQQPWRNAYVQLLDALGWDSLTSSQSMTVQNIARRRTSLIDSVLASGRCALTSSAGRLFDAVAATLGVCVDSIQYEAQAAMALESLASSGIADAGYPFGLVTNGSDVARIDPTPMWKALVDDLEGSAPECEIARRFHLGLAESFAKVATGVAHDRGLDTVVLSGGCMANQVLVTALKEKIEEAGLKALTHRRTPPGDGGVALGQLAIAAAKRRQ